MSPRLRHPTPPNRDGSYLELIRYYAARHDTQRCLAYLRRMEEEGLDPLPEIYTDVIYALARRKEYEEARRVFESMRRHKVTRPTSTLLNLVLEVAAELKDVKLINDTV